MHTIEHRTDNVLAITLAGEVTAEDYVSLVATIKAEIDQHDKVRMLWDMSDMKEIDPGAIWEDLKLDLKHGGDYEKVAIVGDERWHDWATQLLKPFTEGLVRYFDVSQRSLADEWVRV